MYTYISIYKYIIYICNIDYIYPLFFSFSFVIIYKYIDTSDETWSRLKDLVYTHSHVMALRSSLFSAKYERSYTLIRFRSHINAYTVYKHINVLYTLTYTNTSSQVNDGKFNRAHALPRSFLFYFIIFAPIFVATFSLKTQYSWTAFNPSSFIFPTAYQIISRVFYPKAIAHLYTCYKTIYKNMSNTIDKSKIKNKKIRN